MDPLVLTLNYAQTRLKTDREAMYAGGFDFDGNVWDSIMLVPGHGTLMLLPTSLRADYHTSNSSPLAKMALTDFTVITAGSWGETKGQDPNDGPYITSAGAVAEGIITTSAWTENQGVCLSVFNYNAGAANAELVQWGWNSSISGASGPSFRLANGTLEYWQDGKRVETATINLPKNRQYVDITVLPYRHREFLILASRSDAASVTCWHIAEDETDPVVIPNEKFWVYVPTGQTKVQVHKVTYASTGYATTIPGQFGRAPLTGATVEDFDNDAPAAAITNAKVLADGFSSATVSAVAFVQADGSTAFTPNGSARDVRIKVSMTGGVGTPFVYGVTKAYKGVFADTDDADALDITPYVVRSEQATLEIPDDPSGVRLSFSLKSPETLNAGGAPGILSSESWPLLIEFGTGGPQIAMVTEPADYTEESSDEASRVAMSARDPWKLLEDYQFRQRVPFDGMYLTQSSGECAVRKVIEYALGTSVSMTLEDDAYKIEEQPVTDGEPNFAAEVGDTAAAILDRLHQTFAASFAMGFRPTASGWEFYFLDPDNMSETPIVTLYKTMEDAAAATVSTDLTYGSFRSEPLPIEANEVWVTGLNPALQSPIQAYCEDAASKDPEAAVGSRPENWLGSKRIMGVLDPKVTSNAAAERVLNYLFPIVSARRYAAEWECLWPVVGGVPVWRWDVITLDGRGDYRISTISAVISDEISESAPSEGDGFVWRLCRMTGIKVGTGTPYGQGGRNLDSMAAAARQAARDKTVKRPGWEKIGKAIPREVAYI